MFHDVLYSQRTCNNDDLVVGIFGSSSVAHGLDIYRRRDRTKEPETVDDIIADDDFVGGWFRQHVNLNIKLMKQLEQVKDRAYPRRVTKTVVAVIGGALEKLMIVDVMKCLLRQSV